ncbi:MAG: hypothetical protein DIU83_03135 [Bacillota bacterium]|nr:MAG: hypothetical protein DIU83_03135 [Bacillota bacterium]
MAFAGLGGAQLIIFVVMRLFVRRAMSGRPPLFVRLMVAAAGAVAVLFFAAAAYLYFAAPEG